MKKVSILWTDDEIDLLRPHIIFLEGKGYHVATASNGDDAIKLVTKEQFDLVFLDENMPGKSGLETLSVIKSRLIFISLTSGQMISSLTEDVPHGVNSIGTSYS